MSRVCSVSLENSGLFGISVFGVMSGDGEDFNGAGDEGITWQLRQVGEVIREDFMEEVISVGFGGDGWFGVDGACIASVEVGQLELWKTKVSMISMSSNVF